MATVEVAREDVYRRFAEAIKQGDADAVAELHAPDAVLSLPLTPEGVKGREAVRKFNESLLKALQGIDIRTLTLLPRATSSPQNLCSQPNTVAHSNCQRGRYHPQTDRSHSQRPFSFGSTVRA